MNARRSVMFTSFVRGLYLPVLVASLWILFRGHNAPGGGFIGGLVALVASVIWALAFGTEAAIRRMPFGQPVRCALCGVLLSLASGVPALLRGEAFLTHAWFELPLGFAMLPVSTVMAFDAGVYLCVWGALGGYALALIGIDEAEASA